MKKFLIALIFSIFALSVSATNTVGIDTLALPRSGAVYIYASNPSALYLIKGNDSLTGNVSYMFSGTPLMGSQITLWFNNTTMIGIDRKIYILGVDYTSILLGTNNVFVTCTYNGSAWTVNSVNATTLAYLSDYVTQEQFSDALGGLEDTASLTSRLSNYALLSGATFASLNAPVQANSDSSTKVQTTAGSKRLIQAAISPLATTTYVNSSITSSISTATSSITAAYTAAITANNQTFQNLQSLDTLAAGTISLTTFVGDVYNKIEPTVITGNIILTSGVLPAGSVSTIVIELPSSGAYTVTAGANMNFSTITGSNTHTAVLTLTWSNKQQRYNQQSFSQN